MKRFALALLVVVALTGCAQSNQAKIDAAVQATLTALAPTATPDITPTPELTCAELTVQWQTEINPTLREWDDAFKVANSTARVSLAEPVKDLQRIARALADAPFPECAFGAKQRLDIYTDAVINNFLKFMTQEYVNPYSVPTAQADYQNELGRLLGD